MASAWCWSPPTRRTWSITRAATIHRAPPTGGSSTRTRTGRIRTARAHRYRLARPRRRAGSPLASDKDKDWSDTYREGPSVSAREAKNKGWRDTYDGSADEFFAEFISNGVAV